MRFGSKEAREMHRMLVELGYWLERSDGDHYVYYHAKQGPFTVAVSPSDHRAKANTVALLKRRHPQFFRRVKATGPRRRKRPERERQAAHLKAVLNAADRDAESDVVRFPERPERTQCIDCGRPWLSDLSPEGRACAQCGGPIVLGRATEDARSTAPIRQPWEAA